MRVGIFKSRQEQIAAAVDLPIPRTGRFLCFFFCPDIRNLPIFDMQFSRNYIVSLFHR